MNLYSMDYFVTLASERSFTKAAEKLNVTQQTLSAHISALEKELNVKLVDRTSPLRLTYAGEVFLTYAARFQMEKRNLIQEFADISNDNSGKLRVGITATRGHIIMPSAIAEFKKTYPLITVELHEGENIELIERLKTGDLDMIVAHVPSEQPLLEMNVLYTDEVVLISSVELLERYYADEALVQADLVDQSGDVAYIKKCPFMLVGKRDVTGNMARMIFEKSKVRPDISAMSTNAETLLALAEKSVGVIFAPGELVQAKYVNGADERLRVMRLGESCRYSIHVAWRKQEHVWSAIPTFYEVLRARQKDTCITKKFV